MEREHQNVRYVSGNRRFYVLCDRVSVFVVYVSYKLVKTRQLFCDQIFKSIRNEKLTVADDGVSVTDTVADRTDELFVSSGADRAEIMSVHVNGRRRFFR